ncbi:bacterial transcriptional activator domain-containing protein [Frankia sp. Cas3]|uniref:AfsR/SARP family transcriptional regulator n=1 Tax=Frankia sp. Cas3 TaxID=3073926 RepID=UPI002AD366F1|nr:bacterial transcriptional activator domain-containing protein [Frankia sp. Cas3]
MSERSWGGPIATALHPLLICLLGGFQLLASGNPVSVRKGGKTELLLAALALHDGHRASRESLLEGLWPDTDPNRANQSLSTLLHGLRQQFGGVLHGDHPVLYLAGGYELNTGAGVAVDIAQFDRSVATAERRMRAGDAAAAVPCYEKALEFYRGDLVSGDDARAVIERERLRSRYLSVLARLATHHLESGDCQGALECALQLLRQDPCREDAHRLVMRCHVRLGARSLALRQYRICRQVLDGEYGVLPEPATEALFAQIRLDPGAV